MGYTTLYGSQLSQQAHHSAFQHLHAHLQYPRSPVVKISSNVWQQALHPPSASPPTSPQLDASNASLGVTRLHLSQICGRRSVHSPLSISTHISTFERSGDVASCDSSGPSERSEGAMKGESRGMESVAGLLLNDMSTLPAEGTCSTAEGQGGAWLWCITHGTHSRAATGSF